MSMGIIRGGEYDKVAGYAESGELVIGASTIRKGTSASVTISAGYFTATVGITFADPMPDADYEVILYNTQGIGSQWTDFIPCVKNKTKNGFEVQFNTLSNTPVASGEITCNIAYTAFKLFTVEGLEDLENDVATLKTDVAALDTNVSQDLSTLNWNTQYIDLGTWSTGGIIKKAGVVQFSKIFTVKAGIPASGTLICSGLPRPAMPVEVPVLWDGDSAIGGFFLTTNGNLYSYATVTADTNCRINLCYIAAED